VWRLERWVADDGFAAFFRDAYPRVVGQLRVLTGDLAGAEDVAQEAFVRAASRWGQLARYEQPEAWVRKAAFRLAIDGLRRARRHQGMLARLSGRPEPDATLDAEDRELIAALQRLSLPLREALVLHHCLDLPVEAVAAHSGVSVGTVKSRLARGRERLAALLRAGDGGDIPGTAPEEERHARC
jgi:RNA polymerase sigma-70 factor, ECF subfamily